jgi:hypothetical protein
MIGAKRAGFLLAQKQNRGLSLTATILCPREVCRRWNKYRQPVSGATR